MEILILKSTACLAILLAFYKLFLERLNIHTFKRFYLLGAVLISIIIPFITFIEYIEPQFNVPYFEVDHSATINLLPVEQPIITEPTNYLPFILWSIYGLGVLLFLTKFCINLFGIVSKIKRNEKQKSGNYISVLLHDFIVPHTFFSYIFLNKTRFEAKAIPQEVLLHEQTHAKQKHTLDILFIELLQVVFWFNPLLYLLKKDIKLNHEFLADEAVLKQGIDSSTYQETLLQFSSTANEIPLAHAINYSLIKKRFTIMKTQTSKKAVWLRSFLLLPLLAGLLFSFSGREQVEKEVVPAMVFPKEIENQQNKPLKDVKTELQKLGNYKINYINTNSQNDIVIAEDITIVIDKNDKITLNEKQVKLTNLKVEINKYNSNLTDEQKQKFVHGKIFHHEKTSKLLIQKISEALISNNIWSFSTSNVDTEYNKKYLDKSTPDIPTISMENLNEADKKIYLNKVNKYKEWLKSKNSNSTIQITKKGYVLRNKKNDIILSTDPDYKEFETNVTNSKNSPWKIETKLTYNQEDNKTQNPTLTVNGIECNKCQLNLSKSGIEQIILDTKNQEPIASFKIKFKGKPTESIIGNTLNSKAISYLNQQTLGSIIQIFDIKTNNKTKLKPFLITLVDKNDKNYSRSPIIKKGEVSTLPPPAPPAPPIGRELERNTAFVNVNGTTLFKVDINGDIKYYNRNGYLVDSNGKVLSKSQVDGSKVIPGQKITKVYQKGNIVAEFKKTWKDDENFSVPEPPKPPKPISPKEHIKNMASKDASFFYNGEAVTKEKALELVENNNKINISTQTNNGESTVHLSTKPITIVNGKKISDSQKNRDKTIAKRRALTEERKNAMREKRKALRQKATAKRQQLLAAREARQSRPLAQQFKGMEANGGAFFYEGEKITEAKAIELITDNPKLNVSMHNNNGKSTVHLSKKGIKTVNGKLVKTEN
ncbi:M56 family metallopeptidase [Lacinutrix sp. 5H-3-7-4]|uniref:M56 family metallopeptidase n=1 Tax=Lacinutrix sp. (strain 5H-3-7-4) TaxID=983544 RepID=UPI00020A380A|nr:M56 family metallopeptidase [Lacinutrix sp. 5H-3-7-4]AEH01203.1 peptidase M56 BlaR1 [Lacinutrix sp. 5H-3-7-4]